MAESLPSSFQAHLPVVRAPKRSEAPRVGTLRVRQADRSCLFLRGNVTSDPAPERWEEEDRALQKAMPICPGG